MESVSAAIELTLLISWFPLAVPWPLSRCSIRLVFFSSRIWAAFQFFGNLTLMLSWDVSCFAAIFRFLADYGFVLEETAAFDGAVALSAGSFTELAM